PKDFRRHSPHAAGGRTTCLLPAHPQSHDGQANHRAAQRIVLRIGTPIALLTNRGTAGTLVDDKDTNFGIRLYPRMTVRAKTCVEFEGEQNVQKVINSNV